MLICRQYWLCWNSKYICLPHLLMAVYASTREFTYILCISLYALFSVTFKSNTQVVYLTMLLDRWIHNMVIPPILLSGKNCLIADTHHNMFSLVSGFTYCSTYLVPIKVVGSIPGTSLQVGCNVIQRMFVVTWYAHRLLWIPLKCQSWLQLLWSITIPLKNWHPNRGKILGMYVCIYCL